MNLQGTVAIVTGGGTGIGRAVSLELAQAGAEAVAVNYSRSANDADATVKELRAFGSKSNAIKADVADEAQARQLVEEVAGEFGRLDILVNNAGTTRFIPFADIDALNEDVWDAILDVNLKGAFWCSRAAAPYLKEARGAIVNIASIAALRGSGSSMPYGVSKAALAQLTRGLAVALAPDVRVNAVNPGLVATRWFREGVSREAADAQEAAMAARTPLKRVATPADIAQVVVGLLRMDFVTGQYVVVDGGLSITY
jgi:NAD(P)-dependent dehydrogenase (short-subunit alcohol dehydrogenase family)